jgi:hypothetical protein
MRARTVFIALVTVGATASAVSAAASQDPKSLALRPSDLPSGARRTVFKQAAGTIKIPRTIHGKVYSVAYQFKNGSRHEIVANAVGTVANASEAHAVFAKLKQGVSRQPLANRVRLPRYGEEQVSFVFAQPSASGGAVLVRHGTVLWEVAVSEGPGVSKAKATSELQKYAGKQKARAG